MITAQISHYAPEGRDMEREKKTIYWREMQNTKKDKTQYGDSSLFIFDWQTVFLIHPVLRLN